MHPPPTQKKEGREGERRVDAPEWIDPSFPRERRRFPSEEKRGRGLEIDDGIAAACRQCLPLPSRILVSVVVLVEGNQAA